MTKYLALFLQLCRRRNVWFAALSYFCVATPLYVALERAADRDAPYSWWLAQEMVSLALFAALAFPLVRHLAKGFVDLRRPRWLAWLIIAVLAQLIAYVFAYALASVVMIVAPDAMMLLPVDWQVLFFFGFGASALLPVYVSQTAMICGHRFPNLIEAVRGVIGERASALVLLLLIHLADTLVAMVIDGATANQADWIGMTLLMIPYSAFTVVLMLFSVALFFDMTHSHRSLEDAFT